MNLTEETLIKALSASYAEYVDILVKNAGIMFDDGVHPEEISATITKAIKAYWNRGDENNLVEFNDSAFLQPHEREQVTIDAIKAISK